MAKDSKVISQKSGFVCGNCGTTVYLDTEGACPTCHFVYAPQISGNDLILAVAIKELQDKMKEVERVVELIRFLGGFRALKKGDILEFGVGRRRALVVSAEATEIFGEKGQEVVLQDSAGRKKLFFFPYSRE
jgi:hypothetical protein